RRHTRSNRDWSSDVCSSDLRLPGSRSAPAAAMGDDGQVDEMTGPDAAGIARRRAWPVLVVAAVVALLLDLVSKITVVAVMTPGEPTPWLGDWGRFLLVRNPGAAFSMATGLTWVLTV